MQLYKLDFLIFHSISKLTLSKKYNSYNLFGNSKSLKYYTSNSFCCFNLMHKAVSSIHSQEVMSYVCSKSNETINLTLNLNLNLNCMLVFCVKLDLTFYHLS